MFPTYNNPTISFFIQRLNKWNEIFMPEIIEKNLIYTQDSYIIFSLMILYSCISCTFSEQIFNNTRFQNTMVHIHPVKIQQYKLKTK